MYITNLSSQIRDPNRVNVSIDGKYRFSLDIAQVTDLGLKEGQEINEVRLGQLEQESAFGKLYARSLEYCLGRPRSRREMSDYLYKKTRPRRVMSRTTGKARMIEGISTEVTARVLERLIEREYIDDEKFAAYWVECRNIRKGTSQKKLRLELMQKGIDAAVIDRVLRDSERDETEDLRRVIAKKAKRYTDERKLIQYLMGQGFAYENIRNILNED